MGEPRADSGGAASANPVEEASTSAPRRSRAHNYALAPINTTSARRFGWTWIITLIVLAVGWPIMTAGLINDYTRTDANFINALYLRKDIAMHDQPAAPGGRLVIVGGSDALFGIDAAQIQQALNIPAINYATHAGLGIPYLLDRAQRVLEPGDTVILSLAYGMWADPTGEFQDVEFAYFTSYDKDYFLRMDQLRALRTLYSIPLVNYWPSMERLVRYWRSRHLRLAVMYDVSRMDPNGDIRMTIPGQRDFFQFTHFPMPQHLPARATGALRHFASWAKARGIRLLYTWPNISRPTELSDAELEPSPALAAIFQECEIQSVDRPADNIFPPRWFFDTDKHLNSTGRRIRTQALIAHLAKALNIELPDESAAPWFVMAGPNGGLESQAKMPRGPVRFVYMEPSPWKQGGMSPHELAIAVRGGQVAWYDDRQVEPVLFEAGLAGRRIVHQTMTLPEWVEQFPDCVLVCTRPGMARWDATQVKGLPPRLADALMEDRPFALALGMGKYGHVHRTFAPGELHHFELGELIGQDVPPMQIAVHAPPVNRPDAPLQNLLLVNGREQAMAGRGVRIIAIDPRRSSVIAQASFAAPGATSTTSERFEVIASDVPALRWRVADMNAVIQAGPFPMHLRKAEQGTWFSSPGMIGYRLTVAGIDLVDSLKKNRSLVVRLTFQGPVGAMCRSAVFADRPELFAYLPDPLFIHCTGAPQSVDLRIVGNVDADFSESQVVVAGLSAEIDAPPILLQSIQIAPAP